MEGYDCREQHSVYCEGLSCSRSYSIEEPPDSWEAWPAYQFGEASDMRCVGATAARRGGQTGLHCSDVESASHREQSLVEIFRCSRRSVAVWKGFVPFDVVWALPAQPLPVQQENCADSSVRR